MKRSLFCTLLIILFSYPALANAAPTAFTNTAPTITQHPMEFHVLEGETAEFRVTATGTEPLTYQWQRRAWTGVGYDFIWLDINGAISADYSFIAEASDDGAIYRVVVSNDYGSAASNSAGLIVLVMPVYIMINTEPAASTDVIEGSITGSIFVEASVSKGTNALAYQWCSNTTHSNIGGTPIPGATRANFTIPKTLKASGSPYYYYCLVDYEGSGPIVPMIVPQLLPVASQVATVTVNKASTGNNDGGGCDSIGGETLGMLIVFSCFLLSFCIWSERKKKNG